MGFSDFLKSPLGGLASAAGLSGLDFLGGQSSANRQMRFQEDMAKNAHQNEVKDLIAAGLNPILSATGGRGAATPGGASAPPPRTASSLRDVSSASAVRAQVDLMNAQAAEARGKTLSSGVADEVARAGAGLHRQDAVTGVASAANITQETENLKRNYDKLMVEMEKLKAETKLVNSEAVLKGIMQELESLRAQGERLLLPEKGARGAAGGAVGTGLEVITNSKTAKAVGNAVGDFYLGGKDSVRDMRENATDLFSKLKSKFQRGSRKGSYDDWKRK